MSKQKDFFSTNEVEIPITMKGYPTMTLTLLEILDEEVSLLRQKHLALSKETQEAGQHAYHAKLLGHLLLDVANPLPGMPSVTKADCAAKLAAFFADAKEGTVAGDKKRDLLTNIFVLYWRSIQPEEFFR